MGKIRYISENEIENITNNVIATMKFENLRLPAEEIERGKELLRGNTTAEAEINRIELNLPTGSREVQFIL